MMVYGIKNCNTVKAALAWLQEHEVAFDFHDYKAKGLSEAKLNTWIDQLGWEPLVNKRGTTWRQLDAAAQAKVTNRAAAVALMLSKTSVIKRPLLEQDGKVLTLGFDEATFVRVLK
jgi:Spx/MgsR family transcriptional regulator